MRKSNMTLLQEMRSFSHSGSRLRKRKRKGQKRGWGFFGGIWDWFTGLFSRGGDKEKLRKLQNRYADNRRRMEVGGRGKVVRDKNRVRQHR